jgi:predicted Zn-dependent protease
MRNLMGDTTRRIMIVGTLMVLASFAMVVRPPAAIAGHFLGEDSVDGGEIRYENATKYDGALTRAVNKWNALGSIDICLDDAAHICDLEVFDMSLSSTRVWGYWKSVLGADHIVMNKTTLDSVTPDSERTQFIRATMAHEFGHALGIGDHKDDKWRNVILMYHEMTRTTNRIQRPQAHDREDYYALWQ